MEQRLSLEQRTERLVQRSQAQLRARRPGAERTKPLLDSAPCSSALHDPLVQWRSRRCRGEEPAVDTPLAGRALLGSLQGLDRGGSRDPTGAMQAAAPGRPRDPAEAPWPIRRHFRKHQGLPSARAVCQEPFWQDPCWRPRDSHQALGPVRSTSPDTLREARCSQPHDSHHAPGQSSSSCCAPLHQGAPPCGKRESHQPLLQEPLWGSHDCLGALWCAPHWESRDSQDALRPPREEPLCRGGRGLRSRGPREAPPSVRSSARGAPQGAPWQQPRAPPGPLEDPILWMLRCHRRNIRERLRAIETLLECPPGHPQRMVGPIKQ
nr:uncharacterized protein LOC115491631 isoform X1 [Taeniopygia guttata]